MNKDKQSRETKPTNQYDIEIKQAEMLIKELESVGGAQRLGDAAYETAKEDQAKKGKRI